MECIDCRRASTLLDVPRELPIEGVKEAHRDLMKVWHPDRFGTDTRLRIKAEQRLQEINAAFDHIRICTWWPDSSTAQGELLMTTRLRVRPLANTTTYGGETTSILSSRA